MKAIVNIPGYQWVRSIDVETLQGDPPFHVQSLKILHEEHVETTSWYSPWIVWLRKMLCIGALGHKGYLEKQLRARKRRRNHR